MSLIKAIQFLLLLYLVPVNLLADDWEFVVAPYGQLPSISGDASLGPVEGADVDVGMDDILDNLSIGGMLQVEARHQSGFGFSLNYAFMQLEDSFNGPAGFTSFDGEVFQGLLEAFATYRIASDVHSLDFYGGARWWEIDVDLSAENALGRLSFDRDQDWVDPVFGIRYISKINDCWRLLLQGDIGGFHVSSDSSYNLMGGALWDVAEAYSLALLYRALWVDYSTGNPGDTNRFAYDTVTHGPMVGLVFRF